MALARKKTSPVRVQLTRSTKAAVVQVAAETAVQAVRLMRREDAKDHLAPGESSNDGHRVGMIADPVGALDHAIATSLTVNERLDGAFSRLVAINNRFFGPDVPAGSKEEPPISHGGFSKLNLTIQESHRLLTKIEGELDRLAKG